jgi:hypothetical protein
MQVMIIEDWYVVDICEKSAHTYMNSYTRAYIQECIHTCVCIHVCMCLLLYMSAGHDCLLPYPICVHTSQVNEDVNNPSKDVTQIQSQHVQVHVFQSLCDMLLTIVCVLKECIYVHIPSGSHVYVESL